MQASGAGVAGAFAVPLCGVREPLGWEQAQHRREKASLHPSQELFYLKRGMERLFDVPLLNV